MNRADRLVAMVTHLQGRRVVKAEELAGHFEVSLRTVYRDVAALIESGVPVCGEAGVGYTLMKGYHLPPVMLTAEEAVALFVGGEMVKQFSDASMRQPMELALAKLRSVLPRDRQDDLDRLSAAMVIYGEARGSAVLDQRVLMPIQQAIVARKVLQLEYCTGGAKREQTTRQVEPLGLTFHSGAWYLVAWCRLRGDFRYFKLERIRSLAVQIERFQHRPEFSLAEHLKRQREMGRQLRVRVRFSTGVFERARREMGGECTIEKQTEDGVEVATEVFSLEWLARWLLSFGGEAEALAPAALRRKMIEESRSVARRYEGDAEERRQAHAMRPAKKGAALTVC